MTISHKLKNRLINLSIFLVTMSLLLFVYLLLFAGYKKDLNGYQRIRNQKAAKHTYEKNHLSPEEIVQLGHFTPLSKHAKSSYVHFSAKKDTKVYRIGIFGCSWVFGDEAPLGKDFPSRLAEIYKAQGKEKVEVLNFGVNGYGMHQAFYLWNQLADKYELDVTIFNINFFHIKRDNTFISKSTDYGPLHGRYIKENGKLVYLPVIGKTKAKVSQIYYQPLPPWRYIKYDIKTPVTLRPLLPTGRQLKSNPFYYHAQPEQEWKEVYAALFDSVASRSNKLILLLGDEEIKDFTPLLKNENITLFAPQSYGFRINFPDFYKAIKNHPSALSYQTFAAELYACLNDAEHAYFPAIEYDFFSDTSHNFTRNETFEGDFKAAFLGIDSVEMSSLILRKTRQYKNKPFDFEHSNIKALIGFGSKTKLNFIPVSQGLNKVSSMRLEYEKDGELQQIALGDIQVMHAILGRWDFILNNQKIGGCSLQIDPKGNLKLNFPKNSKIKNVNVFLNDELLLTGKKIEKTHRFLLSPVIANLLGVRGSHNQQVDIYQIPQNGTIDLIASNEAGEQVHIPYLSYSIAQVKSDSLTSE